MPSQKDLSQWLADNDQLSVLPDPPPRHSVTQAVLATDGAGDPVDYSPYVAIAEGALQPMVDMNQAIGFDLCQKSGMIYYIGVDGLVHFYHPAYYPSPNRGALRWWVNGQGISTGMVEDQFGNIINVGDDFRHYPTLGYDEWLHTSTSLMTGPEIAFASQYLGGQVDDIFCIGFEPVEINTVGFTYTPDFMVTYTNGRSIFYEVKGVRKLMSEGRASMHYRAMAAQFENERVQFRWAKQKDDGTFSPKRLPMQGRTRQHWLLKKYT